MKCNSIETDVTIFYEGKNKLTKEEEQDMLDLLTVTVESQASAGGFVDCAGCSVRSVSSTSSSSGSGSSTIPIVAGVVAAAAVLAIAGGVYYKRRTAMTSQEHHGTEKGGDTSESDEDGDNAVIEAKMVNDSGEQVVQAEAYVVGEEGKGTKVKM